MKTVAEIVSWLKTADPIRTILVEIDNVVLEGGGTTTFYLSNRIFVTKSTDTPANTSYDPCLVGGLSFTETLSLDNTASIGYGDLEIGNEDGSKDYWLKNIWVNKPINIYIGDPAWARDDFRIIFSGLISDIASRDRSTINLVLVDKLQKLNNPISEDLLTSVDLASDTLIPVVFGDCFNVTPIVANSSTLTYQVHTGVIEDIIEVRDNGAPVTFTKDLAAGKFTLSQAPYGQITASVQGAKDGVTYVNTVPNIIKLIVKSYGPTGTRLTDSDINLSNFSSFNTLYPQQVGVYCTSRENILDICNQLAASIGCQVTFNSLGLLTLVRLDMSGTGTTYNISSEDIELQSLQVGEKAIVRAATKIGYCKNWTVQTSGLAAGVNPSSVALFGVEYLYNTTTNSTAASTYNLTVEPQSEDTLLVTTAGATTESARRNGLFSTPRTIYTMTAYSYLLLVNLGDNINLTNSRFGLDTTKAGIIVDINRDWVSGLVTLGVLV